MVVKKEDKDLKITPKQTIDIDKELLLFTSISIGEPKPPKKNQISKFKVPETELKMFEDTIEITIDLPGATEPDISLSLTADSLIIHCANKKVAYYTEIKFPEPVIPQSAIVKLKNGSLCFKAIRNKGEAAWLGLEQLEENIIKLRDTRDKLNNIQEQYHAIQKEYQDILVKNKKDIEIKIDNFKISTIEKIIQNIDNFELALGSTIKVKNKDNEQILVGINLILNDLRTMIKDEGVEEIQTSGLYFDPTSHEAIDCIETEKYPENTIIEEYKKGYKYKNRIIRPSKVRVAITPKKKSGQKRKEKKEKSEN
jgi:molecular chaperone GrpE